MGGTRFGSPQVLHYSGIASRLNGLRRSWKDPTRVARFGRIIPP